MAINLNHSQYGAQFKAFVDFAADHRRNESTIVRLEGQGQGLPGPNGEPRVIVAKQGDGYGHVWRGDDSKAVNDNVRDLFLRSILAVCGVNTVAELPANVRAVMKDGDYGEGRPLTVRRILAVTHAIRAIATPAFSVGGKSEAATMLKDVVDAKLAALPGSKNEKAVALKDEMDRIAKNRFNLFFALDMQDLQKGGGSQFDADHKRLVVDPKFKIGDATLTFDRNTPLEEKHDIIAKFVRQDTNAKFLDLDGAGRNKAYAVMSAIAQRFGITMLDGVTKALSTGPTSEAPIKFGQPLRDEKDSPLTFSFSDDGSLRIHYVTVFDDLQLMQESEHSRKVFIGFDKGSSATITADVEIGAEEFQKIAKTDYTQFDSSGPEAAMHRQPDEDEAGVAAMGDFRFGQGVKVSVSCKAVLNGGDLVEDERF